MLMRAWQMVAVNERLQSVERQVETLPAGQVLVRVAGCGICHTDLGFLYDGVPIRHALPLVLGHEISGSIVGVGEGAEEWMDKDVIVPAVIPCGHCDLCRRGRGSICPKQIFPGNDIDGGFASHVVVPGEGLCPVPDLASFGIDLPDLSVIADAVTTPFQAVERSGLKAGELAIFVGIGGVGGFGAQIAAARGATVVAIDVDQDRLDRMSEFGVALALNAREQGSRAMKKIIRGFAKERNLPSVEWKVFETSGTPSGQETAFTLMTHGGWLGVVGFTPKKVELRFSNLMALDAVAQGNWGCLPELYAPALDLVLNGSVVLEPFIERHPMSEINETLEAIKNHDIRQRVVLIPDFD